MTVPPRLRGRVVRRDGCLVYEGSPSRRYGEIRVGGGMIKTHRYAYEYAYGPILAGLCVCHSCDEPKCVRLEHLFLGTHAENMADMVRKGRQRCLSGENNKNAKLTNAAIVLMREARSAGEPRKALATRFGVSENTVSRVATGAQRPCAGGPITLPRRHKPYKRRKKNEKV